MRHATKFIAACALAAGAAASWGQALTAAPPQNVLQLAATGTVEVQQDLLSLQLSTTREGPDAAKVQSELKAALDAALAEARKTVQPGQMDVRTGNFSLFPRHGRDGRISGWQGTAELVLEGRDFARITQVAGRIPAMTVASVGFGLSREQRAKVEGEAQAQAIQRFKAKAGELAKGFGFTDWSLREVSVQAHDQGQPPRPRMMAMEAKAASADMAVPVEAGKSTVTVTVSGTVQLR
ncbi:MAG TPA: SIMPL domain-containing protein [Ramlibacter sp.]|nr:SIMPL domain-containing protein [Ramlibacter sp.]